MKHTKEEYFDFMFEYEVGSWREDDKRGISAFSVTTQHVYGKNKYDVLDKMWDKVEKMKLEVEEYNMLPTLEELYGIEITDTDEEFFFRPESKKSGPKDYYPVFVNSMTADEVSHLNKIGLKQYNYEITLQLLGLTEEVLIEKLTK